MYNDNVARLEGNIESNNAKLLDLQADMYTVTTRLRELNNAITDLETELADKR